MENQGWNWRGFFQLIVREKEISGRVAFFISILNTLEDSQELIADGVLVNMNGYFLFGRIEVFSNELENNVEIDSKLMCVISVDSSMYSGVTVQVPVPPLSVSRLNIFNSSGESNN
ncbi:hypothetical protein O9993_12190 [Vibrio lentus]|nr:hypothetical protein [Vibrio lentus]